jgi:hypothetical protein
MNLTSSDEGMCSSPCVGQPLSSSIPRHTPQLVCATPPMSPQCCSQLFVDASSPDASEGVDTAPSTPTARQQRKRPAAAANHHREVSPLQRNKRAKTFPLANMDSVSHHGPASSSGCLVEVGTASIKQQAAAWLESRQQQSSFNSEGTSTSLFSSRSVSFFNATTAATGVAAWSSLLHP